MVINGESGSGKTETFKYAVEFLTKVNSKNDSLSFKIIEVIYLFNC